MTSPPDDQGSPGSPKSPGVPRDGSTDASGAPAGPEPRLTVAPQDALARLLDRRATVDGAHSEALLRALVDASPLAMWILDPEGRVVLWNSAATRLTGWSADEALGRPVPIIPPDKIEEFRTLFAQVLRKEPVVDAEVRRCRKDGTPIELSLSSAAIVAPDGAVVAVLVMAADLTVRKEAAETARRLASERAAREAADAGRDRLAGIVESISDGYAAFDREWRYTYVNRRYAALIRENGRDPDSLIGRVVWQVFPELVGTKFHGESLRAASEGQPVEFDEYYAPLDQTFNVRVFPTPDGFVSISRDVSERRRAKRALEESESRFRNMAEELRQSERRYRRIFDTVEVSIWEEDFSAVKEVIDKLKAEGVTDIRRYLVEHPDFVARAAALVRVRDVNEASLVMFGARDKSELLASLDRVFVPETLSTFAEEIAAIFDGRTRLQSETPGRTLSGQPLQLAFSIALAADDPQLRSVLVSMLDITERKRVEAHREQLLSAERGARERIEQLQAVTAALVEAVTVEDVADRVVETVRATTSARSATLALLTSDGSEFEVIRMLGLSDEAKAKWRRYPADPGFPTTHAVRTGEPVFLRSVDEIRERFPKVEDRVREYGFAATAVLPLVVAGKTVGTLGLNYEAPQPFDASKRAYLAAVAQQCAQALERARLFEAERAAHAEAESTRRDADAARTAAEEASRAKSDFLATMSHELRTPLNAIIGYQNLLADGVTGPISDAQRRQLDRIGASAHHLLMLIDEVLTLSRVEAGKEVAHVERVDIARVLDEAGSIIEPLAKQKSLEFRVIEPESPIVVESDPGKLRQAVLNLLSNAVKFTGRGSVTLRAFDTGDAVAFEVRDTGIGIAAEHLERIFEPFWQVEASTTRTAPGTGLGLAVTRRLAHLLGGEVSVQSAVGEGSTFTIRVPRNAPHS
jgi:PAS domain S-box-containing protein